MLIFGTIECAAMSDASHIEKAIVDQLGCSILYAPWRDTYQYKPSSESETATSNQDCAFCLQVAAHEDERYLILGRFKHHVVMLNLFPYAKGHLLIVPHNHIQQLSGLSQEAQVELMRLITISVDILHEAYGTHGTNIGINLGKAAGASMPNHLHVQIVPRFESDRSFIQVIGKTEVASCDLSKVYEQLKPQFENLALELSPKE